MRAALPTVLILVVACGEKGSPPSSPPAGPLDRLEGRGDAAAIDQLPKLGPFPAASTEIGELGLLRTRLAAVLSRDATLDQVNGALSSLELAVATTRPGSPFVTLAIPAVANATAAAEVARAVLELGPFVSASPAFEPRPDKMIPGSVGLESSYLGYERFMPAWNVELIANTKVAVRCADAFTQTTIPDQLDGILTLAPGSTADLGVNRKPDGTPCDATKPEDRCTYRGNHGFWTMSILGAAVDEISPTGTSPAPERLLDLQCVQSGGLTFNDVLHELGDVIPAAGPVVITMSLGYDPLRRLDLVERAEHALQARVLLRSIEDRAMVFTSAGNDGQRPGLPDAGLNSPFTTQSRFENLELLVPELERGAVRLAFEQERRRDPRLDSVRGQTLIVGAAQGTGERDPITRAGEDVRMVGDLVTGTCVEPDADCNGRTMQAPGTSGATPQAAGLAAYLWSIEPALAPADMRALLLQAFDGRWIDAFNAVLALDGAQTNGRVRDALLDVDGDALFTEADIERVLDAVDANMSFEPDPTLAVPDFGREDLNGDGFTRSDSAVPFDLTADLVPLYTLATPMRQLFDTPHEYDENGATDVDVLCFYAASDRYTGDRDRARQLLVDRCVPDTVGPPPDRARYEGTVTFSFRRSFPIQDNFQTRTDVETADGVADMSCTVMDGAVACTGTAMTMSVSTAVENVSLSSCFSFGSGDVCAPQGGPCDMEQQCIMTGNVGACYLCLGRETRRETESGSLADFQTDFVPPALLMISGSGPFTITSVVPSLRVDVVENTNTSCAPEGPMCGGFVPPEPTSTSRTRTREVPRLAASFPAMGTIVSLPAGNAPLIGTATGFDIDGTTTVLTVSFNLARVE